MQQKNLDYLKTSLKYMGFGDSLNEKLEMVMKKGLTEAVLQAPGFFGKENRETVDFGVNVKKGKEDIYFINSYDGKLTDSSGKSVELRVYNDKGKTITAKEAYNLLSGRAVYRPEVYNKNGEKYDAWIKLDFSVKDKNGRPMVETYSRGYGFDLEKVLDKYKDSIVGLDDPQYKKNLMRSLERGNRQAVDYNFGDNVDKAFLETNVKYKDIAVYNAEGVKQFIPRQKKQSETSSDVSKIEGPAKEVKQSASAEKKSKSVHKTKKQKSVGIKM